MKRQWNPKFRIKAPILRHIYEYKTKHSSFIRKEQETASLLRAQEEHQIACSTSVWVYRRLQMPQDRILIRPPYWTYTLTHTHTQQHCNSYANAHIADWSIPFQANHTLFAHAHTHTHTVKRITLEDIKKIIKPHNLMPWLGLHVRMWLNVCVCDRVRSGVRQKAMFACVCACIEVII